MLWPAYYKSEWMAQYDYVYVCKWIDNEIAEVFVLWREAPNYLHMLMLHCLKIANELMFWRRLLIKSKEVSISLLEICKLYLISDIIYFFLINPNIIYLAQFTNIKYQLSKFWAHIRYQISMSTPPQSAPILESIINDNSRGYQRNYDINLVCANVKAFKDNHYLSSLFSN